VTFLELWLGMAHPLSCGSGWRMNIRHSLSCGSEWCVTGVSVRVVARTEGLHSIEQSQVVANDVLILCREYELWFVLRTPPSITESGP